MYDLSVGFVEQQRGYAVTFCRGCTVRLTAYFLARGPVALLCLLCFSVLGNRFPLRKHSAWAPTINGSSSDRGGGGVGAKLSPDFGGNCSTSSPTVKSTTRSPPTYGEARGGGGCKVVRGRAYFVTGRGIGESFQASPRKKTLLFLQKPFLRPRIVGMTAT